MAVLGSVSKNGDVWASMVIGKPGFMRAINENKSPSVYLPK
ncbi:hypothetical protein [Alkalihalobacillus sp. TS-13]